jgi:hypothetical protein
MSLIPDLLKIISEYVDPETYINLKSLNIPVIVLEKYEILICDEIKNSESYSQLSKLITEFKSLISEYYNHIAINGQNSYNSLLEEKITDVEKKLLKVLKKKSIDLINIMRDLGYMTYDIHDKILIIKNIKFIHNIEPDDQIIIKANIPIVYNETNLSPFWKLLFKFLNNIIRLRADSSEIKNMEI